MGKHNASNDDGKRSASDELNSSRTRSAGKSRKPAKAGAASRSNAKAKAPARKGRKAAVKPTVEAAPAVASHHSSEEWGAGVESSALLAEIDRRIAKLNTRLGAVESAVFAQLAHLENQVTDALGRVSTIVHEAVGGENVGQFLHTLSDTRDRLTAVLKKFDVPEANLEALSRLVAEVKAQQKAQDGRLDGLFAVVEELAASFDRFQSSMIQRFEMLERYRG